MTKKLKIKICGIKDPLCMSTACSLNVDFVGLVFYEHSPRNITFEIAKSIIKYKKNETKIVALTVDCNDNFLDSIFNLIRPDYFQLHGSEQVSRCLEIKNKYKEIAKLINNKTFTFNKESYKSIFFISYHMTYRCKFYIN